MKSVMYVLLAFTVVFLPGNDFAQEDERDLSLTISPGVAYQGQYFGELNVMIGQYESGMCSGNSLGGVRIGAETNFAHGDDFLFAPKVGVELSGLIVCFRATALTYLNGRHAQLRLLPEVGISLLCFVNLTYGYSFALNRSDFIDLPGHRFTLSINLNRPMIYDVFGI